MRTKEYESRISYLPFRQAQDLPHRGKFLALALLVTFVLSFCGAAAAAETPDASLSLISCPELDFTTMADPSYSWDYQEGTGVTIYTGHEGYIPYVIVWQSEDLIVEAFEYIKEQFTPHVQEEYGDDLVDYVEYEAYDIGGRQLPAGLYTYMVQGQPVEMLRLYDSTGDRTAAFTAKYLQGEGDATLAALDTAVRYFKAGSDVTDPEPTDGPVLDESAGGGNPRSSDRPVSGEIVGSRIPMPTGVPGSDETEGGGASGTAGVPGSDETEGGGTPGTADGPGSDEPQGGSLNLISCPEHGFTTMADASYPWEFDKYLGITIRTGSEGLRIPNVTIRQRTGMLDDPYKYVREDWTPYMLEEYDMVNYVEYEAYDVGGMHLPGGLYTYNRNERVLDELILYHTTGERTFIFKAVYVHGEGETTLAALDTAVRNFKEDNSGGSSGNNKEILFPMDLSAEAPNTRNGTYWVRITDTDKIFNGGSFTASLYEQDRYLASGIEGLTVGDQVQVDGQVLTVSAIREQDGGDIGMSPTEDFEGNIVFKNQGDHYVVMVDDWVPISFVSDYKVMLPLPNDFSYVDISGGEDAAVYDADSFISLLTGSNAPVLTPYDTVISFQDDLVMMIAHTA